MRKLALTFSLAALSFVCLISCAEQNKTAGPGRKTPIVVPKGKTYVVLKGGRKEVARYSAGQVMAEDTVDCVKIPCPPTFPSNYVCWECKSRPEPTPPAKLQ